MTAPQAFISFHHSVRSVAGKLQRLLKSIGFRAFLAHEDIDVSDEWQKEILREIQKADLFVALINKDYNGSAWCLQEAGIAAYRRIPIIPLSFDRTVPKGFVAHVQARNVDPDNIGLKDLLPGLMKRHKEIALDAAVEMIGLSKSFRAAEGNFQMVMPYLGRLSDEQARRLLKLVRANTQVHHATRCASEYIPALLDDFGRLLSKKDLAYLRGVCKDYGG